MTHKTVKNLIFHHSRDTKVVEIANRLAALQHLTALAAMRILIIEFGGARIKELEQKQMDNQSASVG